MYRLFFLLLLGGCSSFSQKDTIWARADGAPVTEGQLQQDKKACDMAAFAPESDINKPGPRYMSMAQSGGTSRDIMRSCMESRGYHAS